MHLAGISLQAIEGQKIKSIRWGNATQPNPNKAPYSSISLEMEGGRTFVITQCWGEVNISELKE